LAQLVCEIQLLFPCPRDQVMSKTLFFQLFFFIGYGLRTQLSGPRSLNDPSSTSKRFPSVNERLKETRSPRQVFASSLVALSYRSAFRPTHAGRGLRTMHFALGPLRSGWGSGWGHHHNLPTLALHDRVKGHAIVMSHDPTKDTVVDGGTKAGDQETGINGKFIEDDARGSYGKTSRGTRTLVSFLTGLVNRLASGDRNGTARTRLQTSISTSELLRGVRADYLERMYLWTGDIDAELYDEDCVFTDPTLSFRGLSAFEQNIANLKPFLDRLVKQPQVELFSIELDEDSLEVRAKWRMRANIALPWDPAVDLGGRTTFSYDPQKGNRIVDYREEWDIEAGAVLMQLLRPRAGGNDDEGGRGRSQGGRDEQDERSIVERWNSFLDTPFLDPTVDNKNETKLLSAFKQLVREDYNTAETLYSGGILWLLILISQQAVSIYKHCYFMPDNMCPWDAIGDKIAQDWARYGM